MVCSVFHIEKESPLPEELCLPSLFCKKGDVSRLVWIFPANDVASEEET